MFDLGGCPDVLRAAVLRQSLPQTNTQNFALVRDLFFHISTRK